jgi:hypothetical protein
MNRLRTFGAFLYDFVIGDDPMVAAVIVIALGVTVLIASGGNRGMVGDARGRDRRTRLLSPPRHRDYRRPTGVAEGCPP